MDDVVVFGITEAEHNERLQAVLEICKHKGLTLNRSKCLFKQDEVPFMGNIVSRGGVKSDSDKVTAICNLPAAQNETELRRVLGMVNYLGRFIDGLSMMMKPMSELLKGDVVWQWGPKPEQAFQDLKRKVSNTPVLAFYDLNRATIVSADASSYGLGGVLLQKHGDRMKPAAYCLRTLTTADTRYAQIEKELPASVWVCDRFYRYLIGLESFCLQTDQKPLINIISIQDLDKAPIRYQRLLMKLRRVKVKAKYLPGKQRTIADTLSRSPHAS